MGSSRIHLAAEAGFLGFFHQACSSCYPHFCLYHTHRARGQCVSSVNTFPFPHSQLPSTMPQITNIAPLQFVFTMHWHAVGDREISCWVFHFTSFPLFLSPQCCKPSHQIGSNCCAGGCCQCLQHVSLCYSAGQHGRQHMSHSVLCMEVATACR